MPLPLTRIQGLRFSESNYMPVMSLTIRYMNTIINTTSPYRLTQPEHMDMTSTHSVRLSYSSMGNLSYSGVYNVNVWLVSNSQVETETMSCQREHSVSWYQKMECLAYRYFIQQETENTVILFSHILFMSLNFL